MIWRRADVAVTRADNRVRWLGRIDKMIGEEYCRVKSNCDRVWRQERVTGAYVMYRP